MDGQIEKVKKGLIGLEEKVDFYQKKYGLFVDNKFSLIKSLSYFDEAEGNEMPKMITPVSWEQVKKFFTAETIRLGKKYLDGTS